MLSYEEKTINQGILEIMQENKALREKVGVVRNLKRY